MPRDRFLTGGRAWTEYRSGTAGLAMFGLTMTNGAGGWWIAVSDGGEDAGDAFGAYLATVLLVPRRA